MEQRPLRLGDVVDDYCPRERRVTNHAIVALVGETIRQTRCTTCNADHVYKGAHEPRRRKKGSTTALFDRVLADVTGAQLVAPRKSVHEASREVLEDPSVDRDGVANVPAAGRPDPARESPSEPTPEAEAWLSQRQLIRATLPKIEGEQPATPRPIPEFTMHQRQPAQGYGFRHGQHRPAQGGGYRSRQTEGQSRGGNTSRGAFGNGPHANNPQYPGGHGRNRRSR